MANPVWDLLTRRLRTQGPAPALTFLDSAGARTELSSTSLENAVAKIANALGDEWGLEPGDRIAAYLPWHWQRIPWSLAAWSCGISLDVQGPCEQSSLTVCGPSEAPGLLACGEEPVVISLHPFGLPITDLDPRCIDAASVVRMYGDHFAPPAIDKGLPSLSHVGQQFTIGEAIDYAAALITERELAGPGRVVITNEYADSAIGYLLPPLAPLLGVGAALMVDSHLATDAAMVAMVAAEIGANSKAL